MIRARLAPTAARTSISRRRAAARATNKFPTFAQASRTIRVMPMNIAPKTFVISGASGSPARIFASANTKGFAGCGEAPMG